MRVSIARAVPIQSTVPSPIAPAMRSSRGDRAATSTGTACSPGVTRPALRTHQSAPSNSTASPRSKPVRMRTYSSVLRPGWSYDIP